MACYNIALAYLLTTFIAHTSAIGIGQSVVVPKTFIGEPVIAPELFHDSSFAFASIKNDFDKQDSSLQSIVTSIVTVQIVGKKSSSNAQCSIKLTPEMKVTKIRLSSLRRATENKVLLTISEEFQNGRCKSSVIWMNVKECTYSFAYDDFLPNTHFVIPSNNLVSRNKFRVFIADIGFCKGSTWCSLQLPFNDNGLDTSNIEFPWEGSRIESIEDLNVDFYAYHYHDKDSNYKMILGPAQPPKYTKAELLSLKNSTYSEVMSSQLSVCWTIKASLDKTVNCSKFNNYGRLMFNKTVTFPSPMTLLHVKDTKDGLLLFASKTECRTESCSDVFVSKISENDKALQVTYRVSNLDCTTVDVKKIVFDAREENDKSIRMEYVCSNESHLSFNDLNLMYN